MKIVLNSALALAVLAPLCLAQEEATEPYVERLVVPFRNDGAKHLSARLNRGGMTITGYEGEEVIIEARKRQNQKKTTSEGGLRTFHLPSTGIYAEEHHNQIEVGVRNHNTTVDVDIKVPFETSLKLVCHNSGKIVVDGTKGEIDASNHNGGISISNAVGVIVAHSSNGSITVTLDEVFPDKPMSFTTMNGDIDVSIPSDTKAQLNMHTFRGNVKSDFDIEIQPEGPQLKVTDERSRGGRYRIEFEKGLYGNINGGGPQYVFKTHNGEIRIRQRKANVE